MNSMGHNTHWSHLSASYACYVQHPTKNHYRHRTCDENIPSKSRTPKENSARSHSDIEECFKCRITRFHRRSDRQTDRCKGTYRCALAELALSIWGTRPTSSSAMLPYATVDHSALHKNQQPKEKNIVNFSLSKFHFNQNIQIGKILKIAL